MIEYSASERASRPDKLSTVTAAVVQYIGCCCIPFFATSAHRALPGPGVYRFEFSRKAGALTRKRKATQRAAFLPNLAPALMSLSSRRTALLPPPLTEPYMRFSRIRLFRKSQVEVHMFTQTCGKGTNFFHKQLNLCQFHLWRWLLLVSIL